MYTYLQRKSDEEFKTAFTLTSFCHPTDFRYPDECLGYLEGEFNLRVCQELCTSKKYHLGLIADFIRFSCEKILYEALLRFQEEKAVAKDGTDVNLFLIQCLGDIKKNVQIIGLKKVNRMLKHKANQTLVKAIPYDLQVDAKSYSYNSVCCVLDRVIDVFQKKKTFRSNRTNVFLAVYKVFGTHERQEIFGKMGDHVLYLSYLIAMKAGLG